ncbi:MAG: hypothetical protein WBA10_11800 [Elainellaceae cyanobacterium]
MRSKKELQAVLKEKYAVNKNISEPLTVEDCEQLLTLLSENESAAKLVGSFVSKNSELSQNNRQHGQRRSQVEKKLQALQNDYIQLEQSIQNREWSGKESDSREDPSSQEYQELENKIKDLTSRSDTLVANFNQLKTENNQLVKVNAELKKDNKLLKNIVDKIKLQLARKTNEILQYEDSEIRKALIRLFQGSLG